MDSLDNKTKILQKKTVKLELGVWAYLHDMFQPVVRCWDHMTQITGAHHT